MKIRSIFLIAISFFFIECSRPSKETDLTGNSSQHEIVFKEIHPVNKAVSPTIARLQRLDSGALSMELDNLWDRIKDEGSPLIETDSLYEDYVYATFIYRDPSPNKEIHFEVFGIYDEYRWGDMRLHRLKDTDLYYRCYTIPYDLCFSYRFIVKDQITGKEQKITDPLNANLSPTGKINKYSWSVLDLRADEPDWYTKRTEDAGSKLDTFRITSSFLNNTRDVYVYLPPDYGQTDKKYPVIYLFDSFIYLHRVEVPNVMDNLLAEGKIEPMIAVMIDNPTSTSRLTELPMNSKFKDFMVSELLPEIRNRYNITDKAEETLIGGISYGGLASTYIAFHHPDIFGKVLSQSGSFWRDVEWYDINGVDVRGDWLVKAFLVEEKRNLKLFLDWGLQENWCLTSGRRMVKAFDKKGYDYHFIEYNGWHDWSNSRKTFPEGLMYLLKN